MKKYHSQLIYGQKTHPQHTEKTKYMMIKIGIPLQPIASFTLEKCNEPLNRVSSFKYHSPTAVFFNLALEKFH